MIDYSITIGNIVEICVIFGGGISALAVMKSTIAVVKDNVTEMKRETKMEFAGIQSEIKKIGEVLINQADQNRRLIHLEDDVRELRHGEGFVRGPRGIEREYP
jgi:hypothetical protein